MARFVLDSSKRDVWMLRGSRFADVFDEYDAYEDVVAGKAPTWSDLQGARDEGGRLSPWSGTHTLSEANELMRVGAAAAQGPTSSAPSILWVTVSRVTFSHRRQPWP